MQNENNVLTTKTIIKTETNVLDKLVTCVIAMLTAHTCKLQNVFTVGAWKKAINEMYSINKPCIFLCAKNADLSKCAASVPHLRFISMAWDSTSHFMHVHTYKYKHKYECTHFHTATPSIVIALLLYSCYSNGASIFIFIIAFKCFLEGL